MFRFVYQTWSISRRILGADHRPYWSGGGFTSRGGRTCQRPPAAPF